MLAEVLGRETLAAFALLRDCVLVAALVEPFDGATLLFVLDLTGADCTVLGCVATGFLTSLVLWIERPELAFGSV